MARRSMEADAQAAPVLRANVYYGVSRLAKVQGDLAEERRLLEEAVALARGADAARELVLSLSHLGISLLLAGDHERAAAAHDQPLSFSV